jgi:Mn-dependent DtxR family transcriptional regulator
MNPIAEEMMSYFGCGSNEDSLEHYGIKRRSGRYPWGSGDDPYQHDSRDFLARVEELKKNGWTETPYNIKKEFDLTTTQYRAEKAIAKDERRMIEVAAAKSLKEDGLGATEIARKMSDRFGKTYNESTIRSLLDVNSEARMNQAKETANFIKEQIDKKGMIDVGTGVERELNISKEKLNQALAILEAEGYPVYKGGIPQVTNKGQQTNQKVICPPGTQHKDIYNFDEVHSLNEYISRDDGKSYEKKFNYPSSMDSKRLMIRYKEDGGIEKDGVVELRPGVADLSLGESRYSQVRIMVDDKKYIKGMAVYGDAKDFPDGVDVIFNTNKSKSVPKMEVLKNIKDDPDNPFGSLIKDADKGGQYWYDPKTGKRVSANDPTVKNKKLGLINKRADEGDWTEWKDALPSQFLSKQSLQMAKKQLNLAAADKTAEFDEIRSLTNPTVKKHLLGKFADECDSAAVHLQAAALPGQKYHVIIPITSMKDTEVYAPNYENGTKLALIRYPHGGTFEIPILTVNNKQAPAKKLLGTNISDAIGINSKVAERLSGADFDGDTVMCIPTHDKGGKVKITSTPPLKGLEGFDPKMAYPERPGMKYMKNTGTQMGIVSNLITDMTLKGATQDELARAVRHSMVVIDAEKHKLDYKQSEIDNGIAALKKKYQSYVDSDGNVHSGGASTLISRSKGEQSVLKRQGSPQINIKGKDWYDPTKPEGSLIWKTADDVAYQVPKVNKRTGEVTVETKYRMQKSTKMAETPDAKVLISDADTPMERAYSDYANRMKKLANQARLEMVNTGKIAYSANAKKIYEPEVKSLMDKLNIALLNAPKERQAQLKANAEVQKKIQKAKNEGKELKKDEIKKSSQQALTKYREEVGSVSRRDRSIKITDKEWEAIQAGAISENNLKKILNNTDIDSLRERATPRTTTSLSQAKINQIKAMSNSNYTTSEIAKKLGVSPSTVSKYMKGVAA